MAIIIDDNFAGVTDNTQITGRTLNNAAGGTVSANWDIAGTISLTGNGTTEVDSGGNANARSSVNLSGSSPVKARYRFDPDGGTSNILLFGLRTVTGTTSGNCVTALLVSHTSLRIRESISQNVTSGTDRATLTVTAPGTTFWLELEFVGLNCYARILNADLSVRNEVTYTFSSLPTGDNWGGGFGGGGTTGQIEAFIVEGASGGGTQTLTPSLFTNNQTFYAPSVSNGTPQILAPGLLTNAQTFYAPSVALRGVTAAYVLANTGPVGGNVQGAMYEVAGLVSPGDYMTYTTVSGPTPSGGTLIAGIAGDIEYTGISPAVWVIQIKINGVDYFETTTVYLYDQAFNLLPPLLTNVSTVYPPRVRRILPPVPGADRGGRMAVGIRIGL